MHTPTCHASIDSIHMQMPRCCQQVMQVPDPISFFFLFFCLSASCLPLKMGQTQALITIIIVIFRVQPPVCSLLSSPASTLVVVSSLGRHCHHCCHYDSSLTAHVMASDACAWMIDKRSRLLVRQLFPHDHKKRILFSRGPFSHVYLGNGKVLELSWIFHPHTGNPSQQSQLILILLRHYPFEQYF